MPSHKEATGFLSSKYILVVILAIIFGVFAYFRFNNLDKRIIFDWDQQSFSTDVRNLIVDHDISLIGPRVTDDKGFFLGPYFTYLIAPFYMASNTHPFGLIPFIIIVNILFFATALYVIKHIWNRYVALMFLLLWAINPLMITYDIIPWWPVLIPLGIILIWHLLKKIYDEPSIKNYVLLGITSGFMSHMHFQFMFINVFIVLFLIIHYITTKPKHIIRNTVIFFAVVFSSLAPLLLFDMRHDFLNSNLFLKYFTERIGGGTPDIHIWRTVFGHFLQPLTIQTNSVITFIFYFGMLAGLFFLFMKRNKFLKTFYLASFFLWIATYLGFSVYGRRPSEYYFIYLYPFIFVALLDLFRYYKIQFAGIILAVILIFFNLTKIQNAIKENDFGLYYKDQAIKTIIPYSQNKQVNVSYDMPLGANNGYDYLLEVNEINPSGNPNDPLIQLRIPPHEGDIVINQIGIFIPEELK